MLKAGATLEWNYEDEDIATHPFREPLRVVIDANFRGGEGSTDVEDGNHDVILFTCPKQRITKQLREFLIALCYAKYGEKIAPKEKVKKCQKQKK